MVDEKKGIDVGTVDHISIVVKDAHKVAKAWESMLGIGPWMWWEKGSTGPGGRTRRNTQGFAYTETGVEWELIEVPGEGEEPIFHSEFMDKWGEGLHHLGTGVDDVDAATRKLVDQGGKVVLGAPGAFSYVRFEDDGGLLLELMHTRDIARRRQQCMDMNKTS